MQSVSLFLWNGFSEGKMAKFNCIKFKILMLVFIVPLRIESNNRILCYSTRFRSVSF